MKKIFKVVLPAAAVAVTAGIIIGVSAARAGSGQTVSESTVQDEDTVVLSGKTADTYDYSEPADPVSVLYEKLGTDDLSRIEAFGVYCDGRLLGVVTDSDAIKIWMKNRLEKELRKDGVVSAEFKKKIVFSKGVYDTARLRSPESIVDWFENEITEEYYTIEEGDSLFLIAEDHGMEFEELMEMNPEIYDPDLCFVGSQLRVASHVEAMPLIVTRQEEETVPVPFETITVESDTMFSDETEILVEGVCGESLNRVNVRYDGNAVVGREVVSSVVVTQPVSEMIAAGTRSRQMITGPGSEETVLTGNGKFMWPVYGGWISDTFGSDRAHKGMDIAAGNGTGIYAAADGRVIAAGWNTGGYGYFVMIDHGEGYATLYAHMSKVLASNGSEVRCGDLIGEVGTTGDSTGDHLHFEVRYQNICQNPALYIRVNAPEGEYMLPDENTEKTDDGKNETEEDPEENEDSSEEDDSDDLSGENE